MITANSAIGDDDPDDAVTTADVAAAPTAAALRPHLNAPQTAGDGDNDPENHALADAERELRRAQPGLSGSSTASA